MEVNYEEKGDELILYLPQFKNNQQLKVKVYNGKKINQSSS